MNTKIMKAQLVGLVCLICPVALTVVIVSTAYAQHAMVYWLGVFDV